MVWASPLRASRERRSNDSRTRVPRQVGRSGGRNGGLRLRRPGLPRRSEESGNLTPRWYLGSMWASRRSAAKAAFVTERVSGTSRRTAKNLVKSVVVVAVARGVEQFELDDRARRDLSAANGELPFVHDGRVARIRPGRAISDEYPSVVGGPGRYSSQASASMPSSTCQSTRSRRSVENATSCSSASLDLPRS